tara:strand:+ start:2544 stop:3083 length:540 start_codon:yes stop_codon:yes gene_type:complete
MAIRKKSVVKNKKEGTKKKIVERRSGKVITVSKNKKTGEKSRTVTKNGVLVKEKKVTRKDGELDKKKTTAKKTVFKSRSKNPSELKKLKVKTKYYKSWNPTNFETTGPTADFKYKKKKQTVKYNVASDIQPGTFNKKTFTPYREKSKAQSGDGIKTSRNLKLLKRNQVTKTGNLKNKNK